MASKFHCDLCDEVINKLSGGVADLHPIDPGLSCGFEKMELCRDHYNALKRLISEWKKLETGFMHTFQTTRTKEPVKPVAWGGLTR